MNVRRSLSPNMINISFGDLSHYGAGVGAPNDDDQVPRIWYCCIIYRGLRRSYILSSYWWKLHTRIGKSTLSRWLLRMTGRSDCIDDIFSGSTKPPSPIRQANTSNSFGCAYRVKPSGGVLEIAYYSGIGPAASIS